MIIFIYILNFSTYGLAMFLDPRFKHSFASNKEKFVHQVELWIGEENFEPEAMETAPTNQQSISSNSIFDLHANFVNVSHEPQPVKNVTVVQELLKYKAEPCLSLNSDPLAYWKVKPFMNVSYFICLEQRSNLSHFIRACCTFFVHSSHKCCIRTTFFCCP